MKKYEEVIIELTVADIVRYIISQHPELSSAEYDLVKAEPVTVEFRKRR